MPTDNRATAERIARDVYDERHGGSPNGYFADTLTKCVLAGMTHRDRTAEREAASKALGYIYGQFAARPVVDKDVALAVVLHALQSKEGYLAAEFDAGERVTPEESAVWEAIGRYGAEVATSGRMAPPAYLTDAVKRLAEQRGAER